MPFSTNPQLAKPTLQRVTLAELSTLLECVVIFSWVDTCSVTLLLFVTKFWKIDHVCTCLDLKYSKYYSLLMLGSSHVRFAPEIK